MIHSIYLIYRYGNIPYVYILLILFSIIKTTLDYRVCSVAYAECKIRGVKRDKSYVNMFLDPIVDVRYTYHVYPLFILGYSVIYISILNHLKGYIK